MGARSRILASGQLARVERRAAIGPESWIAASAAAVFVAGTAAFGGLADRTPAAAEVPSGGSYSSDLVEVTVHDAYLVDSLPDHYVEPADGDRLLVVRMTITDRWTMPLAAEGQVAGVTTALFGGRTAPLQPAGIETGRLVTAWYDGTTSGSPIFQPGVPTDVEVAWTVADDAVAGDTVSITLADAAPRPYSVLLDDRSILLVTGDTVATFETPVTDRGAG